MVQATAASRFGEGWQQLTHVLVTFKGTKHADSMPVAVMHPALLQHQLTSFHSHPNTTPAADVTPLQLQQTTLQAAVVIQ